MDSPVKIHVRRGEASTEDLGRLARRHRALSELGLRALSGTDFSSLVDEAVELVAESLSTEYSAVMELLGGGKRLLLRSGVGWNEGVMGRAVVDADVDLIRGCTLVSRGTTIVGSLGDERRFDIPRLLRDDHGVVSGLSTAIHAGERVFGLLGAYTMGQRWFTDEEARFLETVARILGAASERGLVEERSRLRTEEETKRAEAARRRFRLLSEANELLSASLDCAAALVGIARLAVPALADFCFVDMVEDGTVDRLVVTHADYVEEDLINELRHSYPLDSTVNHGTPKVLRTGRPEFIPDVGDGALVDLARDEHHLQILRRLAPKSYMCVPFQVRRQLVGAISFVSAKSGRRYDEEDLALAESLTRCAALTVDCALHHHPEAEMTWDLIRRAQPDRGVMPATNPPKVGPRLTARQLEVLRLLSEGKPARKISEELSLSETTVRNHIRALLHALGARSQLEAVARARRAGLPVDE